MMNLNLQNHSDLRSPKALAFGLDDDIFSTQIDNLYPKHISNRLDTQKDFLGD